MYHKTIKGAFEFAKAVAVEIDRQVEIHAAIPDNPEAKKKKYTLVFLGFVLVDGTIANSLTEGLSLSDMARCKFYVSF